jgi:hypothetical protein
VLGGGEMLVLGWDEANLLPMLAVLKEDGTVRRFMDTDDRKAKGAFGRAMVTAEKLQNAAFVNFGSEVLLTFPGTTRAVVELNAGGAVKTIPLQIPAGYVLHDVLNSSSRGALVVRVQAAKDGETVGPFDESSDAKRRLFEMSSYDGHLIREFVFDMPQASEVTCGAGYSMTAIFADAVPDANLNGSFSAAPAGAQQLVVATAQR